MSESNIEERIYYVIAQTRSKIELLTNESSHDEFEECFSFSTQDISNFAFNAISFVYDNSLYKSEFETKRKDFEHMCSTFFSGAFEQNSSIKWPGKLLESWKQKYKKFYFILKKYKENYIASFIQLLFELNKKNQESIRVFFHLELFTTQSISILFRYHAEFLNINNLPFKNAKVYLKEFSNFFYMLYLSTYNAYWKELYTEQIISDYAFSLFLEFKNKAELPILFKNKITNKQDKILLIKSLQDFTNFREGLENCKSFNRNSFCFNKAEALLLFELFKPKYELLSSAFDFKKDCYISQNTLTFLVNHVEKNLKTSIKHKIFKDILWYILACKYNKRLKYTFLLPLKKLNLPDVNEVLRKIIVLVDANEKLFFNNLKKSTILTNFAKKFSIHYADEDIVMLAKILDEEYKCFVPIYLDKLKYAVNELIPGTDENFYKILSDQNFKKLSHLVDYFVHNHADELDTKFELLENFINMNNWNVDSSKLRDSINRKLFSLKTSSLKNSLMENSSIPTKFQIDLMSGSEFETFLSSLFEKMGFSVTQTKESNDQGADLLATKNNTKYCIQAKRYSSLVGNQSVQEVVASISYYNADYGIVVTNNYFTKSAVSLAAKNNIKLIDRKVLFNLIDTYMA